MKMIKMLIINTALLLLLLTGCNNTTDLVGTLDVTREIMVDVYKPGEGYASIRWLTEERQEPELEEIEEVWELLNRFEWEKGEINVEKRSDVRFETVDHRGEKEISTNYAFWVTPDNKNIRLENHDKSLYVELNEADSQKLYKLIVGRSISDPVFSNKE